MSRLIQTLLLFMSALAPLLVQGCRFFKAESNFRIHVMDGSGDPITGAQIVIQKQQVAHTDEQGFAQFSLDLPVDAGTLVEINKPSSQLFYAPYFETVHAHKGELNRFHIKAILYAVPKNNEAPSQATATAIDAVKPPAEAPGEIQPVPADAAPAVEASSTPEVKQEAVAQAIGLAEEPPFDPELSAQKAANSLLDRSEPGSRLVTFYTASGRENISDAHILYGDAEHGQWLEGCTTNARGRCTLTLAASFPSDNVHLLIRANNYQPQTKVISLAHGDKVRIDLTRGQSIEVFTLQKAYKSIRGLPSVTVKLGDKEIGQTDSFGYFSYNTQQQLLDGAQITLEAPAQLPPRAVHTLSGSSPWTIVQSFSSKAPPRARLLLLPLKIQNSGGETPDATAIINWDKKIQDGIRQSLINQPPFTEADWERVIAIADGNGLSLQQIGRQGWSQPDLLSEFEWALRPTLILGPAAFLDLSIINADGDVIAASLQRLSAKSDSKVMRALFSQASRDLSRFLAFEGSLVAAEKDGFSINLSQQAGHSLKVGETARLHALQVEGPEAQPSWNDIGSAQITSLSDGLARVRVTELKPRAIANIGQIVALNRTQDVGDKFVIVTDAADKRPLAQANLYLQDRWIGTTDRQGIARLAQTAISRRGVLTAVRAGYRLHQDDFLWTGSQEKRIELQRSSIPIRIETEPSNAQVKLNGRLVGRSPVYQNIDIPGPSAQIEITLNEDYKAFSQVVSFDEDGLDWSGDRIVRLEKDLRREARNLTQAGRTHEAINLLESLLQSHPDYLVAQHELGDIYLNHIHDPIKAAAAFHRVSSRPEVANFSDKRFIGTQINEGIALYHIGEVLRDTDQAAALSSWHKAKELLDLCEGQLHFVPEEQYTQAVHSLSYYRALSLHRIWGLTQSAQDLKIAHDSWKKYIETSSLAAPNDKFYSFLKKAEAFYKQTESLPPVIEQAKSDNAGASRKM